MNLIQQKDWFDSASFHEVFYTDAPLGAFPTDEGTTFSLWAPTAQEVTVYLYRDGTGGESYRHVRLEPTEKGVWKWRSHKNLAGVYYDYDVTVDGVCRRTADPWARACGLNGNRSMVVDLRATDPQGWSEDKAPAIPAESIIWETHVKDFSWDPAGGFDPADRGRYTAFCRTGTSVNGEGNFPTGIDYLKKLGITHVQLMPIYDFGSVDEAGPADRYNWGYDPVNYNVPEGVYSSDPHHGEVRIRELKQAIASLHRNGFRVIMDVVYNHTYTLDSWLWRTVPWYFYRQRGDGSFSDGSGCGSEIASERSMCARYILDSILYWCDEYHIDGFRFDLMGLTDEELMKQIRTALDEKYGKGEKLMYGEPWRGGDASPKVGTVLCDKGNLKRLPLSVGAFCDDTRDAVKGSLMDIHAVGFVNGGGISADKLRRCIVGWSGDNGAFAAPQQTITYLSCHDDWTMWDKLISTMNGGQDHLALHPHVVQANRLAAAINFCCMGHPFLLSGEEFGRTKNGVKNSFKSEAAINRLDWNRSMENASLVDYYRGLIALRKQLSSLQDKSETACQRVIGNEQYSYHCASVLLKSPEDRWKELLLIFNGGDSCAVSLPEGKWQILCDGSDSFLWQKEVFAPQQVSVGRVSPLILGKIE